MIALALYFAALLNQHPFRFVLDPAESKGTSFEKITIYSNKTGKAVWKGRFPDPAYPHWSPDGSRLAWLESSLHVCVWDIKHGERRFQMKNPYSDDFGEPPGYDSYPMWSPDSKFFLVKFPGVQGEYDLQTGALVFINPQTRKTTTISIYACTVQWIDAKTVRYSNKLYHESPQPPTVKYHMWRAPG